MFKFGSLKAFNARNNPRTKAVSILKNGYVVVLDEVAKTATVPATAAIAKGKNLYFAYNIVDKPEIRNSTDFQIEINEYVRAFLIADLVELPVEFDSTIVSSTYSTVDVGEILVPEAATGKWIIADGTVIVASAYTINLLVTEKTSLGNGSGLWAIVKVNDLVV
jgi:hypothetical protein